MDESTIDYILRDSEVDTKCGIPMSAIVFMLYYGLEIKHFLMELSDDFIHKFSLEQHYVGTSSVYLSGSAAQGLYLNTKYLPDARDIDIVTINRKFDIRERCQPQSRSKVNEALVDIGDRGEKNVCLSHHNATNEANEKYLNIKTLPDTPPGYVLLEKCRQRPLPVQTPEDYYVSSLKTTEARIQYWHELKPLLRQWFEEHGKDSSLFSYIEQHGPAATAHMSLFESTTPFEIDMVFCLPYPLPWPQIADEWLHRQRPSGWPSQELINEIRNDGCTLIPKGSLGSPMEDFEWRISFTGDLKLARSLLPVQRELLHVIKAVISEPQHEFEMIDLSMSIESYQFMNLLYFESETLDRNVWTSENLGKMFLHLMDKYMEHLKVGKLNHYFINSRNIFAKFEPFTEEEKDTLLFTLLRIRYDPLGQILQQEKYLRLPPLLHKMVYLPFVTEVKSSNTVPHCLYVNTLVRLAKAHIQEELFESAHMYATDAVKFYLKLEKDTFSDEDYMDLMFTAGLSSYVNGDLDHALPHLEHLYMVMNKKSGADLIKLFGKITYAEILIIYARTLTVISTNGFQLLLMPVVKKKVESLYYEAYNVDPTNLSVCVDMLNTFIHLEDTEMIDSALKEISNKFPELEQMFTEPDSIGISDDEEIPVDDSVDQHFEYRDGQDLIYQTLFTRESLLNRIYTPTETSNDVELQEAANILDKENVCTGPKDDVKDGELFGGTSPTHFASTNFESETEPPLQTMFTNVGATNFDPETEPPLQTMFTNIGATNFDPETEPPLQTMFTNIGATSFESLNEQTCFSNFEDVNDDCTKLPSSSKHDFETGLSKMEISDNVQLDIGDNNNEQFMEMDSNNLDDVDENYKEFTTADVNNIDIDLFTDYCRIKAFEKLGLNEKVASITNRLSMKIKQHRSDGRLVSWKMLEAAFEMFFPNKKLPQPETFFHDLLSDRANYLTYSKSDKSLLNEELASVFNRKGYSFIKVPIAIALLNARVRFYKVHQSMKYAREVLNEMEAVVEDMDGGDDESVGRYLLACHLEEFGEAEESRKMFLQSRMKPVRLSVKEQVTQWFHQMFSVVTKFEPNNKYLDDIFAV